MLRFRVQVYQAGPALLPRCWPAGALGGLLLLSCGGEGGGGNDLAAEAAGAAEDDGDVGIESGDPSSGHAGKSCACAGSDAVKMLSCKEGASGATFKSGSIEATPSGDAAMFMQCYLRDGLAFDNSCEHFRWTAGGGTEVLMARGSLLGLADDGTAFVSSQANAGSTVSAELVARDGFRVAVPLGENARLSADGRYVVDFVPPDPLDIDQPPDAPTSPGELRQGPLARWSPSAGLEVLAELPDDLVAPIVIDVAADASVIVGQASRNVDGSLVDVPLIWTSDRGLREFDGAPDDAERRLGELSGDGLALVGYSYGQGSAGVFRWTEREGYRSIASANPSDEVVAGHTLPSDDGRVLAGTSWFAGGFRNRAYRWSLEGGFSWLGPDTAASRVTDMTADGSVVLGTLLENDVAAGVVGRVVDGFIAWSDVTQLSSALLQLAALDLGDWQLEAPRRISDDGSVVFGFASCGSMSTPYRWVLPR